MVQAHNLILQTAFVGDLFLALPLIRECKALDPETPLVVMCRKGLGEVLRSYDLADHVVEVDKASSSSRKQAMAELKKLKFRHILCPHNSVRSGILVGGLKAEGQKLGYHQWWNRPFFTRRILRPMHWPEALRQLFLLTALSQDWVERFATLEKESPLLRNPQDQQRPEAQGDQVLFSQVPLPPWARGDLGVLKWPLKKERIEELGLEGERGASAGPSRQRIFVAPGSVWATKRWTTAGFAELVKQLAEQDFEVILVGSALERELCDEVLRLSEVQAANWAGKTSLVELLELFRQGELLISNDSGAQHMAAAVGLPVVSIFGPTTLGLGYRPWTERAVVLQEPLSCRPCGAHGGQRCPLGTHQCMKAISVQRVRAAVGEILSPTQRGSNPPLQDL